MAGKPGMDVQERISPAAIRAARLDNPKLRERDLATNLGISEGEYVAAFCGEGATRLEARFHDIFPRFEALGEVMALTRNESAVHEKIGVYDKFIPGNHAAMMLGEKIDMRMFPTHWRHAFAVEKQDGDMVRRSIQFFDAHGDAVHKVHSRPATDIAAWNRLVSDFVAADQSPEIAVTPAAANAPKTAGEVPVDDLRRRWAAMTDTHQFVGIIHKLKLTRHQAVSSVGEDFAWRVDGDSVASMMRQAADENLPIMCFVGSRGCIQIHSGPISGISMMGPWLNVLDEDFHLHLRTDHIAQAWAVRKPTDKGHVTSLEAYDKGGSLIIQFFGKRIEGQDERGGWRAIMESLPRIAAGAAA